MRRPTRDWRGGEAVAGRLKGGSFAYRKWLKPLGVSLRSKCMPPAGNGAIAEPRKARGAKACSVELAKRRMVEL